jgi:hypothetical protein
LRPPAPTRGMNHHDFAACERELLEPYLVIGREVAHRADELHASYLSVHIPVGDGALVAFTWDDGAVWATGRGFDVELSALRAWHSPDSA